MRATKRSEKCSSVEIFPRLASMQAPFPILFKAVHSPRPVLSSLKAGPGLKKRRGTFEWVCERELTLPPTCQPPQEVVNFWFSFGSWKSWMPPPWHSLASQWSCLHIPSATPFLSQLSLGEPFRVALACRRQPCWLSCLLAGKLGWRCFLCTTQCCVYLSNFSNFMEETSWEWITWTYMMAFCHFLLVFKMWPGRGMLHMYPVSKKTIREKAT